MRACTSLFASARLSRRTRATTIITLLLFLFCATCAHAQTSVLNLTGLTMEDATGASADKVSVLTLKGKINHFGNRNYHAIVPDVLVWVAEYPDSRGLGVRSDDHGWWTMDIMLEKGSAPQVSLVYEKQGWITTKSNLLDLGQGDNTDLAIQFVDPDLYNNIMKPLIESILAASLPQGADPSLAELRNAVVATVGKSYASMHDDRLPHGDPGATCNTIPGAIGPVYFNEQVMPDPAYKAISADGGVAWLNVPPGTHTLTATKPGVEYAPVTFNISDTDPEYGITVYVASPPDSIQGNNDSKPGEE